MIPVTNYKNLQISAWSKSCLMQYTLPNTAVILQHSLQKQGLSQLLHIT